MSADFYRFWCLYLILPCTLQITVTLRLCTAYLFYFFFIFNNLKLSIVSEIHLNVLLKIKISSDSQCTMTLCIVNIGDFCSGNKLSYKGHWISLGSKFSNFILPFLITRINYCCLGHFNAFHNFKWHQSNYKRNTEIRNFEQ